MPTNLSDQTTASGPRPPRGTHPTRAARGPRPAMSAGGPGPYPHIADHNVTATALAAGSGTPGAMEDFVRATHRDLWRFLAYLSDVQSADDLTQETYLRAWKALPAFAGNSSARTWLLSIARRVVVDRYRAASARPRTVGVDDWTDVVEHRQSAHGPGFDEGVALTDLLHSLDPARREAFVLTQVLDLEYAETARILDCPIGTVRSRVARARTDLITMMTSAEQARTA